MVKPEDLRMGIFENGKLVVEIDVGDLNYLETDKVEAEEKAKGQAEGKRIAIGYTNAFNNWKYKDGLK